MHRCLSIPELLQHIFLQLVPDGNAGLHTDTRTLLAASLTCHAFSEPALDALWYRLSSPVPLAKCTGIMMNEWDLLKLAAPVRAAHITTLEKYSKRVRIIQETLKDPALRDRILVTAEVWSTLMVSFSEVRGATRFPKLHTLDIRLHLDADYWKLQFCLSPTIRRLAVHGVVMRVQDYKLSSLFSSFNERNYPHLCHLAFTGFFGQSECEEIGTVITNFPELRSLDIDQLSYPTLKRLGKIDCLRTLTFTTPGDEPYPFNKYQDADTPKNFPMLDAVDINCSGVLDCWNFLDLLSPDNSVASFIMTSESDHPRRDADSLGAWASLMGRISQKLTSRSLQILHIISPRLTRPYKETNPPPIGRSLVELSKFSALRELHVYANQRLDLDDDLLGTLAAAWPKLESLMLISNQTSLSEPRNTLWGLSKFAEHCPRLKILHISLDATKPPSKKQFSAGPIQSTLRELKVKDSPVKAPKSTLAFLTHTFPSLQTLGMIETRTLAGENWNKVIQSFVAQKYKQKAKAW